MTSVGQKRRWGDDQRRIEHFVGKAVAAFQFDDDGGMHECLTVLFTDGTSLVVQSRADGRESYLVAGPRAPDGSALRERTDLPS